MSTPAAFAVAILQMLTASGIVVYWILFGDLSSLSTAPCHAVFERAFLLPDLGLAGALLLAAVQLAASRRSAYLLSLLSCGALVYLGALDVSYNFANGGYSQGFSQTLLNVAINAWCLGVGCVAPIIIVRLMRIGVWLNTKENK